jgi:hypothetical protein
MNGCPEDGWFELAHGDLPPDRARKLLHHAETCGDCQGHHRAAVALQAQATVLAGRDQEARRERIWRQLEPHLGVLIEKRRARKAWRTLLVRPNTWAWGLGLTAAATVALVLAWPKAPPTEQEKRVVSGVMAIAPAVPHAAVVNVDKPAPPHHDAGPLAQAEAQPPAAPEDLSLPSGPVPHGGKQTAGRVKLACGGLIDSNGARLTYLRDLPHAADLRLDRGTIDVRVPHLQGGSSLDVRTDDAVVRVVGTRFTVDKSAVDATTVRVQEGTVWVQPRGGHRELIVLHAGQQAYIPSEHAYLAELLHALDVALAGGNLDTAEQSARRYLDAAGDAADVPEVRLRLAGVLRARDRADDAVRQYHLVADGQGPRSTRENALAMLASVYRDQGHGPLELATWARYLERFPHGLHERDAWLRTIELQCGRRDPASQRARSELAERFGGEALVRDVLARCMPSERP